MGQEEFEEHPVIGIEQPVVYLRTEVNKQGDKQVCQTFTNFRYKKKKKLSFEMRSQIRKRDGTHNCMENSKVLYYVTKGGWMIQYDSVDIKLVFKPKLIVFNQANV